MIHNQNILFVIIHKIVTAKNESNLEANLHLLKVNFNLAYPWKRKNIDIYHLLHNHESQSSDTFYLVAGG